MLFRSAAKPAPAEVKSAPAPGAAKPAPVEARPAPKPVEAKAAPVEKREVKHASVKAAPAPVSHRSASRLDEGD